VRACLVDRGSDRDRKRAALTPGPCYRRSVPPTPPTTPSILVHPPIVECFSDSLTPARCLSCERELLKHTATRVVRSHGTSERLSQKATASPRSAACFLVTRREDFLCGTHLRHYAGTAFVDRKVVTVSCTDFRPSPAWCACLPCALCYV
jgi:hypothetical protein